MYPSDISYNAYKYSLPEFDSQSTEASHSSFAKSRDSFFPSAQSKESASFMKDSNYFSQRDPFYPRENFHFPRDSRRKNLFCKEEEQWEPEVSKKLCLEDGFRNKTTSFIDRKEMFNENSNVIANTTINFSNVNSLLHFQRKTPSFYNVKFLEQNCNNEKSFSENNLTFSNKNSRGLKYLSIKVRELVMKKKETSYKDIADQLLREMKKKNTCLENDKEVQNIKRRIYDALNVLVATDIFKKKGKTVVYDGKSNFMSHELLNKRVLVDKAEIMEKINQKKQDILTKQKALQTILIKNLAVKSMLHRNYSMARQQNPQERFEFPFIMVSLSSNSLTLKMNKPRNKLAIYSKTPLNVLGDIDVLLKLNMHKVEKCMIEKWFPKDVIHYLPESLTSEENK